MGEKYSTRLGYIGFVVKKGKIGKKKEHIYNPRGECYNFVKRYLMLAILYTKDYIEL